MSLIKEALNKYDSSYKEKLYPHKNAEITKITKPFCFSVFVPLTCFEGSFKLNNRTGFWYDRGGLVDR